MFGGRRGHGFGQHADVDLKIRGGDVSYRITVSFLEAALGAKKRVQLAGARTLDVTIPPGTEDERTLRLKGQGLPGHGGAPAGDAYIQVHVAPHPHFTRKASNIHLSLPITLQEAVLGASVKVPTIHGAVALKVPAGSNSGQTLRLKGKGIAEPGGKAGDQLVRLTVMLPDKPDPGAQGLRQVPGPKTTPTIRGAPRA